MGSGTGAIAAWEMSLRLRDDGRFGAGQMKLHLSQNEPFTPITDAWEAGSRTLSPPPDGRRLSRAIRARVLGNRNPPYAIAGGLYDALADTHGFMYRVTNADARASGRLFAKLEGCDIDPAAEVACASLVQAVATGGIGKRDLVVLNITGGGHRQAPAGPPHRVPPAARDVHAEVPPPGRARTRAGAPAGRPHMSDLFDKCRTDAGYFGAFRARKDMYFSQPVLDGRVGARMKFQGQGRDRLGDQQLPRHRGAE